MTEAAAGTLGARPPRRAASHAARSGLQPMGPLLTLAGERRLLQCLVPILVGLSGINGGLSAFDPYARWSLNGDSHVRYLSGLILAIGVGFWTTVPAIESHGARFRLLTALVLVGGLGRLYAVTLWGLPGAAMISS